MIDYKVDSIEDLDEGMQKLYEKGDDGYTLKVEGLEIPDVDGLKSALEKERAHAKKAEKALRDAEKKRKAEADEAARIAGDVETIEKNLHEHYKTELESRDVKIGRQSKKINEVLLRDGALNLATKYAVDGESASLLAEWIEHRMEVVEDGDDFKLQPVGNYAGLSVDQFAEKLPQEKALARLIKASEGNGGGASNPAGGRAANTTKPNLGGSRQERVRAIRGKLANEN